MEVATYLEIIRKRWRLVAIGMVATVAFTALFVSNQESVYESSGTYVVRPRSVDVEDAARAIDTLVRGVEINSTFASIASSNLIKGRAKERVDPSIDTSGLKTSGRVITGTNILELSVTGEDPTAVHALAVAVGEITVSYIQDLDEIFELTLLDPPRVPKIPVGPNRPLTIVIGVFLGALFGAALAVGTEAFISGRDPDFGPDSETGVTGPSGADLDVLDENEFGQLFDQQVLRAHAEQRSFTLGMLTIAHDPASTQNAKGASASAGLEQLARLNMPSYRDQWQVVSLGEASFAVIESELPTDESEELLMAWLKVWKAAIGVTELADVDLNGSAPHVSIGISSYGGMNGIDEASVPAGGLTA